MKRSLLLLLLLIFPLLLNFKVSAEKQSVSQNESFQISKDLMPLLDLLKKKGFNIKFEIPPRKNVYGLFQLKNKTLWISPISFSEGLARQTILHEATHAAQSCPNGILTPLDLKLPISLFLKKEIQNILLKNYNSNQYLIEREAYYLQAQRNGVDLLLKAIGQRCKKSF